MHFTLKHKKNIYFLSLTNVCILGTTKILIKICLHHEHWKDFWLGFPFCLEVPSNRLERVRYYLLEASKRLCFARETKRSLSIQEFLCFFYRAIQKQVIHIHLNLHSLRAPHSVHQDSTWKQKDTLKNVFVFSVSSLRKQINLDLWTIWRDNYLLEHRPMTTAGSESTLFSTCFSIPNNDSLNYNQTWYDK